MCLYVSVFVCDYLFVYTYGRVCLPMADNVFKLSILYIYFLRQGLTRHGAQCSLVGWFGFWLDWLTRETLGCSCFLPPLALGLQCMPSLFCGPWRSELRAFLMLVQKLFTYWSISLAPNSLSLAPKSELGTRPIMWFGALVGVQIISPVCVTWVLTEVHLQPPGYSVEICLYWVLHKLQLYRAYHLPLPRRNLGTEMKLEVGPWMKEGVKSDVIIGKG